MTTKTEIKIGDTYLRCEYDAGPELADRLVRITGIDREARGWYDDHQGGGWFSQGSVTFDFADDKRQMETGGGWDSLEYAEDTYDEFK